MQINTLSKATSNDSIHIHVNSILLFDGQISHEDRWFILCVKHKNSFFNLKIKSAKNKNYFFYCMKADEWPLRWISWTLHSRSRQFTHYWWDRLEREWATLLRTNVSNGQLTANLIVAHQHTDMPNMPTTCLLCVNGLQCPTTIHCCWRRRVWYEAPCSQCG